MSLAIPLPERPSASARVQLQAFRQWQAGQGHARRERWGAAAAAFEQATELHGDAAYGLSAAHALIKCGRAAEAVQRAQRLRQRHPTQLLGYTLGVACAAGARPARRGLAVSAPGARRRDTGPPLSDVDGHGAAACCPACRGGAGVPAGAGAEDRRPVPALPPGHLVQAAGHEGRGRRVRAHRGGTGRGQQRPGGARAAGRSWSARPAAGPRPQPSWDACARRCARCRPQQPMETSPFSARGAGRRPAGATEGGAPLCAACGRQACSRCRAAPRARTTAGCAWATCRPTSTPTPPASCWCRCWSSHDRAGLRGLRPVHRARRWQRAAPAHGGRGRTLRGVARPGPCAGGAARARARHRHPGRPEGRHLRHAAAGAGRSGRRRCR